MSNDNPESKFITRSDGYESGASATGILRPSGFAAARISNGADMRTSKKPRGFARTARAATLAIGTLALAAPASAQTIESLKTADKPLVLKSRGSFYVGGEQVEQSAIELGSRGPADTITVNQMYVDYMVPDGQTKLPVVMIHGATLTGKSYDTTPDGRMGWYEYFVRQAHPTYVVDQVGRGRSGFNQAILNRVGAGEVSTDNYPKPWRFGDKVGVWTNFRFGPKFGESFPDSKFPTASIAELAKQSIPDLTPLVPTPNPTIKALSDLAGELNGAVLLSHSQSGDFPIVAALTKPENIRAIVAVEPGRCRSTEYTDEQFAQLAKVPTLVMFGDYLPVPPGFSQQTWQERFDDCKAYVERIKAAKGTAEIIHTPDLGVRGNSHMLMHDTNSLQIADVILKWIDTNARPGGKQ